MVCSMEDVRFVYRVNPAEDPSTASMTAHCTPVIPLLFSAGAGGVLLGGADDDDDDSGMFL